MPAQKTRTNCHIYIRSTTGAFIAGDKLIEVDGQQINLSKNTFEYDFFDSTAVNRVADLRDADVSLSQILNPGDAVFQRCLTAFNSSSQEFVYAFLVFGNAPAAGAVNFCVQGRFIVTDFSPQPDLPGVHKINIGLALESGSSLVVSTNATAFPTAS